MSSQVETFKKISTRFKHYIQEANTVWKTFSVIEFYSHELHNQVKSDKISLPSYQSLTHKKTKSVTISKERIYGTFSHIYSLQNPRNSLIAALHAFEVYISDLVTFVYLDFPQKVFGVGGEKNEIPEKISTIILDSQDKKEIIERIVEEKIRGLFYGNLSDLFLKDRAKLELGNLFKNDNSVLIDRFTEISARRNIYVHNGGKVDRKYIRETKLTNNKIGTIIKINSDYLKDAINIMSQIAKLITCEVLKNIYNTTNYSSLLKRTYWKNQ